MNSKTQSTSLFPIKILTVTAMFTAMNILLSSFGIPVPGGHLYLNDVIICTAAMLLNPFCAFFMGGVGAFLGDFFFYPTPMFVSLVTHGLQAVVISVFSHYVMKKRPVLASVIGTVIGAIIMIGGYSLGLSAPVEDSEDAWFGHGGAWGTNCSVNWHKKELKLWVIQSAGGPQPWGEGIAKAAEKFFSQPVKSGVDSYTGRTR